MLPFVRVAGLFLGSVAVLAASAHPGSEDPPTIEIRVVDPTGRAVPSARALYSTPDTGMQSLQVTAGACRTTVLRGTATVAVWDARDDAGRSLALGPACIEGVDEGARAVVVTLPPEMAISGVVLGPGAKPMPGIRLRASGGGDPDDAPFAGLLLSEVSTDASGSFRLGGLAGGLHEVRAEATSGTTSVVLTDVVAPRDDLEIRVRVATDVVLTVCDPDEKPVAEAVVTVIAASGDVAARIESQRYEVSDAQGRVRLASLSAADPHELTIQAPMGRRDVVGTTITPWTPRDEIVRLPGALAVRGRVVDTSGKGLSGVRVFASDSDPFLSALTDPDGSFECGRLRSGVFTIQADLLGVPGPGPDAEIRVAAGVDGVELRIDAGDRWVLRTHDGRIPRDRFGDVAADLFLEVDGRTLEYGAILVDGALEFRRVRSGVPWTLWIPWSEEGGGTLLESGPALDLRERTLVLEPGREIRGAVSLDPGRPCPRDKSDPHDGVVARLGPITVRGTIEGEDQVRLPRLPGGPWGVTVYTYDRSRRRLRSSVEAWPGETVEFPVPTAAER